MVKIKKIETMKLKLHNITADYQEDLLHIHFNGKDYELTFESIKFEEHCTDVVENAIIFEGGYAEYYNERQCYDSIEDYIEEEGETSIVQEIFENITQEEFFTIATELED